MHGAYTEHCKNLKEIPAFVDFYEKNSDRVEILGVNYEQTDIDKKSKPRNIKLVS
jgi:hypothetical protein